MKARTFEWDYKEQPPIAKIVRHARQNPDLKMFEVVNSGDTYVLIFAPTKAIATEIAEGPVVLWRDETWR